jgi:hypothetical protein
MAPVTPLHRAQQRGAVLLLLLAVIGLGAASLLMSGMARYDTRAAPERKTEAALKEARDALIGFAATHGRLPRPARDPASGREFDGRCDSEQSCTGLLPWVTLGIAPGDGWGRLLRYSVTPVMTSAPVHPTVAVGTKAVLTRAGAQLVYLAGHPSCSLGSQCPAAIVLSSGRDNLGVSLAGIFQPGSASANVDERANAQASSAFMLRARSDGRHPGGEFDDQLAWITVDALLGRMSRAQVLPRAE